MKWIPGERRLPRSRDSRGTAFIDGPLGLFVEGVAKPGKQLVFQLSRDILDTTLGLIKTTQVSSVAAIV